MTSDYTPPPSSGGGGGTPSGTVTGPDAYGAAATPGVSSDYSRGDHDHGLPAAPAVPGPATTVTGPDAFGAGAAVGASALYAREDHDHGLPAAPAVPAPASAVTGPDAFGAASAVGTSANYARQDHDHGLPANPAPGPATTVVGPDAYSSPAVVGTSALYARADHDHGLPAATAGTPATAVTGPDAYGSAAVVGSSTNYARQDHDHGLPTSAAFVSIASGLVRYYVYYNGTNYLAVATSTGAVTSNANGVTLLNSILAGAAKAIIVYLDPALSITGGAVQVLDSNRTLIGDITGNQDTNGPLIGQLQIGNGSQATKIENITTQGLTVNELDFLSSSAGTNIQTGQCRDLTVLATGAAGGAGIVMDGSGGGYVQYWHFSGHLYVHDANWTGSSSPYNGGWFTVKNMGNGMAHITFDDVEVLHAGVTQVQSSVHLIGGASANQCPTILFKKLDVNMANATSGYFSFVQADVSTAAINADVTIELARAEIHATSGIGATAMNITGSSTVANVLNMDIFKLYTTGTPFQLTQSTNPTFAGHSLSGLNVHNWTGKGTSDILTWGSAEATTFPIYLGNTGAVGAPTGSGAIISNPVAGTILSVGGTAAFAFGTTYTCGGTPLEFQVTGTVTLKTSDGSTILSAVAVTNKTIRLLVGMSILVATGGSVSIYKGI